MKFVIDRSRWSRGPDNETRLLNSKGKMCCLGFFLEACGIPPNYLLGKGEPHEPFDDNIDVPDDARFLLDDYDVPIAEDDHDTIRYVDSSAAQDLVAANDDVDVDETVRELNVTRLFQRANHEVSFVDSMPDKPGPRS